MELTQQAIAEITKKGDFTEICKSAKENGIPETAVLFKLDEALVWAIVGQYKDDQELLEELEIKLRPYDVWNFPKCHDLVGYLLLDRPRLLVRQSFFLKEGTFWQFRCLRI